eukprot:gene3215-3522_t
MLAKHQYADVPSAVRELTDKYGLRVVVDGSHPVLDTPHVKGDYRVYSRVLGSHLQAEEVQTGQRVVSSTAGWVPSKVHAGSNRDFLNEAVEEINDCGPNMGRSTILTRCSGSVRIALARSTSPTRASMSLAASTFRLLELQALSVALQQAQWASFNVSVSYSLED